MVSLANVIDVAKKMLGLSFQTMYLNEAGQITDTDNYKRIFSDINSGLVVRGEKVQTMNSAVGTITLTNIVSAVLLGFMTQFGVISMGDMLSRMSAAVVILLVGAFIVALLEENPIVPNRIVVIASGVLVFEIISTGLAFVSRLFSILAMFSPISCIELIVYLMNIYCYACILGALVSSPSKKKRERTHRRRPTPTRKRYEEDE